MTRTAAISLAVVLAGCDPPTPPLLVQFSNGPAQACGSTDCADIPMSCRTWISIRIVDPSDPTAPFLSQCDEIPENTRRDLCAINRIDVLPLDLPLRDLEVQIALYPESRITMDPVSGLYICPADTQYDAVDGFPVISELAPALGGRTYYRAGDEEILLTLGCSNLDAINAAACIDLTNVFVRASVDDFDDGFSVEPTEADRLLLAVGEPETSGPDYVLNQSNVTAMDRTAFSPPAWAAEVEQLFTQSACVSVLADTPQSTTTVTCRPANVTDDELDLIGVRLTKASLDEILDALSITQFPTQGLTIGVVLDDGFPLGNQVVTTVLPTNAPMGSTGTIEYLSADRSTVSGSATSSGPRGGVFISRDAPYGTEFSTTGGLPPATIRRVGGRILDKVTIVVLDVTSGAGT